MREITRILATLEQGDPHAAAQLAGVKPGQTLDATALVHEAYLRLVGDQHFDNHRHLFVTAAAVMRCILIDQARHKHSQKRGGIKGGQVIGRMERIAATVEDRPVSIGDFIATICNHLPSERPEVHGRVGGSPESCRRYSYPFSPAWSPVHSLPDPVGKKEEQSAAIPL